MAELYLKSSLKIKNGGNKMNKVIIMGRLTKEPELRQTPQGTAVCSFTIAVNRRFAKDGQQDCDFINCTAWQNTAEFICKYFHKGDMIAVVGRLETRQWEKDGKKQFATDVVIEEAHFCGSKKTQETQEATPFGVFQDNTDDLPFA